MKIVHVTTGLGDGGAEAILFQLCKSEREHEHVVVSLMDSGKYGPPLRAAGIQVHCLGMPRGRVVPGALWRLRRILRQERPAIVQTWMYHADLIGGGLARLSSAAKVCWGLHTSTISVEKLGYSTYLVAQQCARLSRVIPSRIISCSDEGARHHASLGYASERLVVVPNGYDLERFRPDPDARARVRAEWQVGADDLVIGMVARFDPLKDHGNLIAAMRQVQDMGREVVWVLAGNDMTPQNETLTSLLQQQGIRAPVHLLGARPDIPAIMNGLDIHVLSSLLEGFPNVVSEAMACGTPCVTTAVGDAALIVGDTGWVVPARDAGSLAQGIAHAIGARQDASAWVQRSQAARARIAERFSAATMCNGYRAVWKLALAEGPASLQT